MPFTAALSVAPQSKQAVDEVCARARAGLDGRADLAVLFFSPHHLGEAELLGRAVQEQVNPARLLGCVGEAIIGTGREVEQSPALSLWLGRWSRPVTATP